MALAPYIPMDAAIARVLSAARDADAAVEECARAARQELDDARATEKSIAAAAARRIARVRAAMAQRGARCLAQIAALEREATAHPELDDEDLRRLDRALAVLAAELTGEER